MTANLTTDADSSQTDAEGAEGGDKPPHDLAPASRQNCVVSPPARVQAASPSSEKTMSPSSGGHLYTHAPNDPNGIIPSNIVSKFTTVGSVSSPSTSPIPTLSESKGHPSKPPTSDTSRTASQSSDKTGPLQDPKNTPKATVKQGIPSTNGTSRGIPKPPSDAGSSKFNLRDLLGAGPNLARRTSNRSASTRRSDSERGASSMGDTSGGLAKKYGVCERLAIGKGATSVVRIVHKWDRTVEKLYAVKEFRKRRKNETEKEYVKKLTAEFCISSTLHHANVVETVDLVQDEQLRWCEVMEYCPGGDLYAAIKKGGMSVSEMECCFRQIVTGVEYLHSQGVAHRDLKPENIYFDIKGVLKIGDYGASTVYRLPWETTVHMSTGLCGSEPYIAPEQFGGKPYDARLVDIWACGIIFYCLEFQVLPWRVAQPSEAFYASYAQAVSASKSDGNAGSCPSALAKLEPRSCRPVLRKMLEPDPRKRWTTKEILAHSWPQSIEVCALSENPTHVHSHAKAMLQQHAGKMQDSHNRA